jgi:hypothetical protein
MAHLLATLAANLLEVGLYMEFQWAVEAWADEEWALYLWCWCSGSSLPARVELEEQVSVHLLLTTVVVVERDAESLETLEPAAGRCAEVGAGGAGLGVGRGMPSRTSFAQALGIALHSRTMTY